MNSKKTTRKDTIPTHAIKKENANEADPIVPGEGNRNFDDPVIPANDNAKNPNPSHKPSF